MHVDSDIASLAKSGLTYNELYRKLLSHGSATGTMAIAFGKATAHARVVVNEEDNSDDDGTKMFNGLHSGEKRSSPTDFTRKMERKKKGKKTLE